MIDVEACAAEGCLEVVAHAGFCSPHYYRQLRRGTLVPERLRTVADRLKANSEPDGECLMWTGGRAGNKDYGRVSLGNRKQAPAHRAAYLEWVGPIPDGFHIHHLCGRKLCIQPEHLVPIEAGLHKKLHNLGLAPSLGGIHA